MHQNACLIIELTFRPGARSRVLQCSMECNGDVSDSDSAQGDTGDIASISPCTSSSGPSRKQRRKCSLTSFNEEWKKEYLMYQAGNGQAISAMECIVCGAVLTSLKLSTIKRHIQRCHKENIAFAGPESPS